MEMHDRFRYVCFMAVVVSLFILSNLSNLERARSLMFVSMELSGSVEKSPVMMQIPAIFLFIAQETMENDSVNPKNLHLSLRRLKS